MKHGRETKIIILVMIPVFPYTHIVSHSLQQLLHADVAHWYNQSKFNKSCNRQKLEELNKRFGSYLHRIWKISGMHECGYILVTCPSKLVLELWGLK